MNDEKRPQQVPANADGNLRETHDDESALHSDWGSDESIHESLGDGRPRDAIDEHQGDPRGQDVPDRSLLNESGARSPDSLRLLYTNLPCESLMCILEVPHLAQYTHNIYLSRP